MNKLIMCITVFLMSFLFGCSGGGGENIAAVGVDPTIPVSDDSAKDLVSNSNFNFSSSYKLDVDVDISNNTKERAFLSVCSNFTEDDGEVKKIDYENCILRTGLDQGRYQGELKVTNDKVKLVSAIWFYDSVRAPIISVWNKGDNAHPMLFIR